MPSRNILRQDVEQSYYHVYARGSSRQPVFLAESDYFFFISLFKRYLSKRSAQRKKGPDYPNFRNEIKLLAYCLMTNHFHLYVYQINQGALTQLMRGVMTSYSRYFNSKYKRSGSLFENRYMASLITTDRYNTHISRYIHMNPRYWLRYPYSSLQYYVGRREAEWLHTASVMSEFRNPRAYLAFLEEYQDRKSQLDEIKHYLANH